MTAPERTAPTDRDDRDDWDDTADVVVIGYGGSGATLAAVAAGEGADVLVIEKGEQGGGNSVCVAGSLILTSVDDAGSLEYLDWLCGGQTEHEVLQAYIDGLDDIPEFQSHLGFEMKPDPQSFRADGFFPEFPGAPGAGSIQGLSVIKAPGGAALYNAIAALAEQRGARVRTQVRATRLVQDPASGEVLGVEAVDEATGRPLRLRGARATVIATGGFEFDADMKSQYLTSCPIHFMGSANLTGDGIKMAQAAGAQLWHMNSAAGPLYWGLEARPGQVYATHDFMAMAGFGFESPVFKGAGSLIWVDKRGRRFADETVETGTVQHGYRHRGLWLEADVDNADFAHVPSFLVFDHKAFEAGAVMTTFNSRTPEWSDDNRAELDEGIIVRADTLEELAEKCAFEAAPGAYRGGHIPPEALAETVAAYNASCTSGEPDACGREHFRVPLDQGPFYAVGPLHPTYVNTHGGPKHDARQRVLDHADQPIPRLYAVGECGSMWGPYYNSMGDITEFMVSGRTAAQHIMTLDPLVETGQEQGR